MGEEALEIGGADADADAVPAADVIVGAFESFRGGQPPGAQNLVVDAGLESEVVEALQKHWKLKSAGNFRRSSSGWISGQWAAATAGRPDGDFFTRPARPGKSGD